MYVNLHQTSGGYNAITNNVYHDDQGNIMYKVHTPFEINRTTTITKTIRRSSDEQGSGSGSGSFSRNPGSEPGPSENPQSSKGMSSEDLDKARGSGEDLDDAVVGWEEEDGEHAETDKRPELPQSDSETFMYLAQIQWRLFKSSKFRFGDGNEVQAKDYFRKQGWGWYGRHKAFTASDGKEYIWKLGHHVPELYLNDDSKTPIAVFHRKRYGLFSKSAAAYLEIYPEGQHIIDEILVTFIYIEKLRKDKERASRSNGGH